MIQKVTPEKKITKSKKISSLKMNKPQPRNTLSNMENIDIHIDEIRNNKFFDGIVPHELNRNLKSGLIKVSSIPAKGKSNILFNKLSTSDYTHAYLDKYVNLNIVSSLNDHIKMLLVYGINFIEVLMIQPTVDIPTIVNPEEKSKQ